MRDLAKFLYTHNPFYLISSACVLFGFRSLFSDVSASNQVWQLAVSLAGYTLLLALTAIAIVRLGNVWEDARTVALLAILMCLALSVSFDLACNRQPGLARVVLVGGLLFSCAIVKLLAKGLPIHLPRIYQWPLLAALSLFFIFPIAVTGATWGLPSMAWRVLMFPLLSTIAILFLIPAIRRGPEAVNNNGSPWPWPYYPWSIFFFILIGMVGRSYLLTISFQLDRGMQSTFAPYYLVPIAIAVIVLMFEGAMHAGLKGRTNLLCFGLIGVVIASSLQGLSPASFAFHHEVTRLIGSPLWLSTLSTLFVAAYFAWRGASAAYYVFVILLVIWIGVDHTTIFLRDYHIHNPWPLLLLLGIQILRVLRLKSIQQLLLAVVLANAACAVLWPSNLNVGQLLLRLHLSYVVIVLGCFVFHDWLAIWLRAATGAIGLPIVLIVTSIGAINEEARGLALNLLLITGIVAVAIAIASKMACWRVSCAVIVSVAIPLLVGRILYQSQWMDGDRARWSLLTGTLCFLCGAIISAAKAGFGQGWMRRLRGQFQLALDELQVPTVATDQNSRRTDTATG